MLVMSLSPLLGQAIPDIAETAEIVVFPQDFQYFLKNQVFEQKLTSWLILRPSWSLLGRS